jgi:branched-chain amino acid transport system substrate-binding protein
MMLRAMSAVAAVASLCALLGCSKKDEGSPQTGASPAPAPLAPATPDNGGVTDAEVVVGEPAAFSGPSAGLGVEMWRGASAAFSEANEAGVAGRKVRLVVADDAYDAEKAATAALQLVSQDHVFCLFGGVGTPTIVRALPVVRQYFDENGLFYFANFTGAQPQRQPPNFKVVFNVRAGYAQETQAMVDAFVAAGRKNIGVFLQDDAYGVDGRSGVEKALAGHGMKIAAEARYPRGQTYDTSTKPQLDILRQAGTDAVVIIGSYQASAAFVRDARAAGWDAPLHNVSFVGADQLLDLLRSEEARTKKRIIYNLINTQVVPHYDDAAVPAVAAYRSAIGKYHPDVPSGIGDGSYHSSRPYSFGSLEGYVSARTFLAVLAKTGRALTRKSFYEAAEGMGKFDVGLGVPAELSPSRHQALDKVWFTYATPDGWKSTEAPMTAIK